MTPENIAWTVVLPLLGMAFVLASFRLARGPSVPDRIVALDLIMMIGVGLSTTYAIASGQPFFLDVAIVVALVSFLGTVAFAIYLERTA